MMRCLLLVCAASAAFAAPSIDFAQRGISDIIAALNGTQCFQAVSAVTSNCGNVSLPSLSTLKSSYTRRSFERDAFDIFSLFSRRDSESSMFTLGINSTDQLDRVCSSSCQTAIKSAGKECTAWIEKLASNALGATIADNFDPSEIFDNVMDYTGLLCVKDSAGNYCTQQIANTNAESLATILEGIAAALKGNTTLNVDLTSALKSVCTECLYKLVGKWASLSGAKSDEIDAALKNLDLACATDPNTEASCISEYASFASKVLSSNAEDAVATIRNAVCEEPSPCLASLSTTLRTVEDSDDSESRVLLQVLSSADLCALNGEETCLDLFASISNTTTACIKALDLDSLSKLKCSNLPTECKTALTALESTGCCAKPIASALGFSFLPKILPCASISTSSCAAPEAVGNLTFDVYIPNLNYTRVIDLGILNNITEGLIQDLALRFQIPTVMINITSVKAGDNGEGIQFIVFVEFPSNSTLSNAAALLSITLPFTASSLSSSSSSEALTDVSAGLSASVVEQSTITSGTGTGTSSSASRVGVTLASSLVLIAASMFWML